MKQMMKKNQDAVAAFHAVDELNQKEFGNNIYTQCTAVAQIKERQRRIRATIIFINGITDF